MLGAGTVTIGSNTWNVEIAGTPTDLATGLSGRASLAAGTVMLSVLPSRQAVTVQTIYMLFPLDIIFIKDNLVLDIARNVAPGNTVNEATPYDGFLEVNAGEAASVSVGEAVVVVTTTPPKESGFNWSSIMSFAIPIATLGVVVGLIVPAFPKVSPGHSSGHHSWALYPVRMRAPEGNEIGFELYCQSYSEAETKAKEMWPKFTLVKVGEPIEHSIHGEPRQRLIDEYGSWAVGRAEANCPEGDVECVRREAKALYLNHRARRLAEVV